MEKKIKVIVAHPGKQHSMHTSIAFENEGILFKYITTVYDCESSIMSKIVKNLLNEKDKKKAESRKNSKLPNEKIELFYEIFGLFMLLVIRIPFLKDRWNFFYSKLVYLFGIKVAKYAIHNNVDAVIMYDLTSEYAFRYLKKHAPNIIRILDCSIANRVFNKAIYENDILISGNGIKLEQKYLWKKKSLQSTYNEVKLADYFLVPSTFVAESYKSIGVSEKQLIRIPYGVDINKFKYIERNVKDKIQLLYVGEVTRRKGMHHLLEIISKMNNDLIELIIVGKYDKNSEIYKKYSKIENIHFKGFVTHDILIDIYKLANAFILPSLSEGLALVGLEAMASGLPVFCSTNTGINDLIDDYENGIVFPVSDKLALENILYWIINNSDKLNSMGKMARAKVINYSWENYYSNLINKFNSIIQIRKP